MEQQNGYLRLSQEGYPAPVKLGARTVAWRVSGMSAPIQPHANSENTDTPPHTPTTEAPPKQIDAILVLRLHFRWCRLRLWIQCRYSQ